MRGAAAIGAAAAAIGAAAVAIGAAALAIVVAGGCGSDRDGSPSARATAPQQPPQQEDRSAPQDRDPRRPQSPAVEPARCPATATNCRTATGRIVYVEAIDPDGDGDAHFVLVSRQSITSPGISVIDVGRDLRPRPLPGVGDEISAAGPVHTGSYGQRQIEATVLHVARRAFRP